MTDKNTDNRMKVNVERRLKLLRQQVRVASVVGVREEAKNTTALPTWLAAGIFVRRGLPVWLHGQDRHLGQGCQGHRIARSTWQSAMEPM